MKARVLLAALCVAALSCGPAPSVDLATEETLETVTQALALCSLTVKNPYRSGSYVYGDASVSCSVPMNIDMLVTIAGPNTRSNSKSCINTKYCSLVVSAPYAQGSWQTRADSDAITNIIPPSTWSDYRVSSWVSL